MNTNINNKINFFKPGKKMILIFYPVLLLFMNKFSIKMTLTWCVGGEHKSKTINQKVYKKVNSKTKKLVKIIKRKCDICGCNKSQIFTK